MTTGINIRKFKLGDVTDKVWVGDIVTKCEFLSFLDDGRMLFYDITFKCFRLVFWEQLDGSEFILNGWQCANKPSKLI